MPATTRRELLKQLGEEPKWCAINGADVPATAAILASEAFG